MVSVCIVGRHNMVSVCIGDWHDECLYLDT